MMISTSFLYRLPVAILMLVFATVLMVSLTAPRSSEQLLAAVIHISDDISEIGLE